MEIGTTRELETREPAPTGLGGVWDAIPPPAMLTVREGPDAGWIYPLDDRPLMLGRAPDCQIRWDDIAISRHHCQINLVDGEYEIEDLGSSIHIGDVVLEFRVL
jgi:pSer/pThr/pTyr-binding forkhead associated (FHA) protein